MPYPTQDRTYLKRRFEANNVPTEQDYADLIDAAINLKEDGVYKLPGDPLVLDAAVNSSGRRPVLQFNRDYQDESRPDWLFELDPRESSALHGLNIADGAGDSALFIAAGPEKRIGVGTLNPEAHLHVQHPSPNTHLFAELYDHISLQLGGAGPGSVGSLHLRGAGNDDFLFLVSAPDTAHLNHSRGAYLLNGDPTVTGGRAGRLAIGDGNGDPRLVLNADGLSYFANGYLGIGTEDPRARLHVVGGAIMPAPGESEQAGILFPKDPYGGSGDTAWLRYYNDGGEATILELGIANDGEDRLVLESPTGIGVRHKYPQAALDIMAHEHRALALRRAEWDPENKWRFNVFGNDGGERLTLQWAEAEANHLTLTADGRAGFGTENPNARVHIANESPRDWRYDTIGAYTSLELGQPGTGHVGSVRMHGYDPDHFIFIRPSNGNYHLDSTRGHYYINQDPSVHGGEPGIVHIGGRAEDIRIRLAAEGTSWFTGGGLALGSTATVPYAKLQVNGGAIVPQVGAGDNAGITFPRDPYGGGGDVAWIRYYSRGGESMTFELGIEDNVQDVLALKSRGGIGVNHHDPVAAFDIKAQSEHLLALRHKDWDPAAFWRVDAEGTANNASLAWRWTDQADTAFALTSGGRAGFGTPAPGAQVHIANDSPEAGLYQGLKDHISLELGQAGIGGVGSIKMHGTTPEAFTFIRPSNGNFHLDTSTGHYFINYDAGVHGGNAGRVYVCAENADAKVLLNAKGDSYFSGGRVGIGTERPDALLHLANPSPSNWRYPALQDNISLELGANVPGSVGSIKLNSYDVDHHVFIRPSNGNYHLDSSRGYYYFNHDPAVHGGQPGRMYLAGRTEDVRVALNTEGDSYFTGGNMGIGTATPLGNARLQVVGGAIVPQVGNDERSGIMFPRDPHGGSGDTAWLRYFSRGGESMTLELAIANDGDDKMVLKSSGGVGINVDHPNSALEVQARGANAIATHAATWNPNVAFQLQAEGGKNTEQATFRFAGKPFALMTMQEGGRTYFRDLERFDGGGLRVGAAWGKYGIYAEVGPAVVGGVEGTKLQNESVTITLDGDVAIGKPEPTAKLDVEGTIKTSAPYVETTAQKFTVGGSLSRWYPVLFEDQGWSQGIFELEIFRHSTHIDSSWRGSLMARIRSHNSNWGHGSEFWEIDVAQTGRFIGRVGHVYRATRVIVWLRGGNTTYHWRSNHRARVLDYQALDNKISYPSSNPAYVERVSSLTAVDSGFNTNYFYQESRSRGSRFTRGMIMMWSGSTVPSGWAICDGGNGTPDLRGRFVVGAGQGQGLSNRGKGATGGTERVTLDASQMPVHSHAVNDPGHYHNWTATRQRAGTDDHNNTSELSHGDAGSSNIISKNTNVRTTGISLGNAGGGAAHENMPPFYALAYIMKL
ncbi:MAG: hypothetical protein AAGN35_02755 [Bacteroidota bacterium]